MAKLKITLYMAVEAICMATIFVPAVFGMSYFWAAFLASP